MSTQETAAPTTSAAPEAPDAPQIAVIDPATGRVVQHVPDLDAEAVRRAAERGRAVQPAWAALGFEGRARILRRAQKWVVDHREEIIRTVVSETGKVWEDAQLADYGYGAAAFGFWADNAEKYLAEERVKSASPMSKGKKLLIRYEPLGLVGVIGPWNYPLANSVGDAIPALAAGNSVLLKPSEETPLTSLLMERALLECGMPEGVFQVVTGRGQTGAALIDVVDMIMFTGSTRTGKLVAKAAAEALIPCSLELGGKDAMVVLADADLDRAANQAVFYSMFNAGQTCVSVERVYVEAPVYDAFVAKVVEKARTLRSGVQPSGPGATDVGALTFPPQLDTVRRHVDQAREAGATIAVGGNPPEGPGLFYPPTVLTNVDHSMAAMTEETFGPTLPIMKVADVEEAIKMANDSPYGLMASVFTKDAEKGEAVARRLEAGMVHVNAVLMGYLSLELPMGGWKTSGVGSRHGVGGIRKYTKTQSIVVSSRMNLKREPYEYPYTGTGYKLVGALNKFLYGRGRRD